MALVHGGNVSPRVCSCASIDGLFASSGFDELVRHSFHDSHLVQILHFQQTCFVHLSRVKFTAVDMIPVCQNLCALRVGLRCGYRWESLSLAVAVTIVLCVLRLLCLLRLGVLLFLSLTEPCPFLSSLHMSTSCRSTVCIVPLPVHCPRCSLRCNHLSLLDAQ